MRGGGGGGKGKGESEVHKNISQILAAINFSSGEIDGKFFSVWKNFILVTQNLGQTSCLNLDKFGIGNDEKLKNVTGSKIYLRVFPYKYRFVFR